MRFFLTTALAASCIISTAAAQNVRRAEAVTPPRAQPETGRGESVTLRGGDTFEMYLSGMPIEDSQSLARQYTVSGDGTVNIPYAGQIRAAGLSQGQLEQAIEQRFISEKIFRWPTVTINVQAVSRYITIGGQVRAPQRFVWSTDMTLTSAIAAAGGPGDFGGDKVTLVRNGKVTLYSIKKLKRNPADDPKVLPGDLLELL
jgi:polysaccharide export outer membrane protein